MTVLPPRPEWAAAFGARVHKRRKELGLTLSDLGAAVGSHRQSVWRWEHGEQLPDAYDVAAIAKALRIQPSRLLDD
jgi:transcriptional regulator with XRE-family HTH domain